MKLFLSPGACSLSPHIALREAGIPFTMEFVDTRAKKTRGGEDYKAINPKGYVPALMLDDGELLTEGPAIVQFIADLKPESNLAPKAGTMARVRLQEMLSYLTSEVHKTYTILFQPAYPAEAKEIAKKNLSSKFDYLDGILGKHAYLLGDTFSVADGYLFTMLRWADFLSFDLSAWKNIVGYKARVAERPKVKEAIAAEMS